MTDSLSQPRASMRRLWPVLAATGLALVLIALAVVCLVIADKPHFGNLVGPRFLPIITSGIFVGAFLLGLATWNLPVRRTWKGIVLFVWALIALTSPLFGFLFLLPWSVLVLSLPLVAWIVIGLFRAA